MKLMQVLKNKKGFTLMELIVVLIIIAILMAALLPALIGWINDARESGLRAEGRTALLAIQTVVTEAKGTGYWNAPGATVGTRAQFTGAINSGLLLADTKFIDLLDTSNVYQSNGTPGNVFAGVPGTRAGVVDFQIDAAGNVVGVNIASTLGTTRNTDLVGGGKLLVGQEGTAYPVGTGYTGGGGGDDIDDPDA